MFINIFGKWIRADLIKGIKRYDAAPFMSEASHYTGASVILSTFSHYMSPGYYEDNECKYNDYIWFPDKTEDELANEINKQMKTKE